MQNRLFAPVENFRNTEVKNLTSVLHFCMHLCVSVGLAGWVMMLIPQTDNYLKNKGRWMDLKKNLYGPSADRGGRSPMKRRFIVSIGSEKHSRSSDRCRSCKFVIYSQKSASEYANWWSVRGFWGNILKWHAVIWQNVTIFKKFMSEL